MRYRPAVAIAKCAVGVSFLLAMLVVLNSVVLTLVAPQLAFAKDEPKWIEVHTAHFSVLTDAGGKPGREVALRTEQLRPVFCQLLLRDKLVLPLPITAPSP